MAKRDAEEVLLNHLFGDDDSEGDSDDESTPNAGSVGSDGDSLFGELSFDIDDLEDMYSQSGCRPDNDRDDEAHSLGANPVNESGISLLSQHENNADGTAQNLPSSVFKNRSSTTAACSSQSEGGRDAYSVSVGSIIGESESIIDNRRTPYAQNRNVCGYLRGRD